MKLDVSCGTCAISYVLDLPVQADEETLNRLGARIKCMLCQGPVLAMQAQEDTAQPPKPTFVADSEEVKALKTFLNSVKPDVFSNVIVLDWNNVNRYFSQSPLALQAGEGWKCRACDAHVSSVKAYQVGNSSVLSTMEDNLGLPATHHCKNRQALFTVASHASR